MNETNGTLDKTEGTDVGTGKKKNDLHGLILGDLTDRDTWAQRQTVWYQMRNHGLRRKNKPWPGAADLHFPLCDSMIDKWKPFYFQQVFATETVASFISKDREHEGFTGDLEYHFDYKLKEETNLAKAILVAIDKMLCAGTECVKVYWDTARKRVAFDALEPTRCIVPWYTKELQDGDRFVHVLEMSVEQYKANPNYRQDEEFVKRITGKGAADSDSSGEQQEQEKQRREGITVGSTAAMIVVWEAWEHGKAAAAKAKDEGGRMKDEGDEAAEIVGGPSTPLRSAQDDGKKDEERVWRVHTYSPLAPEEPVRATIENPYDHGRLPVVRFDHEIKDLGHYDSRGIPEIAGAFETSLTKTWNEKHDFMTFCNRPMFTSEKDLPNTANIRAVPGQILPFAINRVEMGQPPVSFDVEMNSTRLIAEYRLGMPDFGTGQALSGGGEKRTATEVDKISGLVGQGVDLRSHMFRLALAELYQQAWALLLQFDQDTKYVRDNAMKELPKEALEDAYKVQPKGSSDSWNRNSKLQKAVARKQLLGQSPWINQAELDKSILELDDPKLVARLFVDPNAKAQDEAEDEMKLIPTLLLGSPIAARPGQDHVARVRTLVQFIQHRKESGQPLDAAGATGIQQRLQGQLAALQAEDPKMAAQLKDELTRMFQPQAATPDGAPGAVPGT